MAFLQKAHVCEMASIVRQLSREKWNTLQRISTGNLLTGAILFRSARSDVTIVGTIVCAFFQASNIFFTLISTSANGPELTSVLGCGKEMNRESYDR